MRQVTGKPIKLMGTGEKLDGLEDFHPERIAGRILGMGDVVSLVEKAALNIDQEKARKIAERMKKGAFDLDDLAGDVIAHIVASTTGQDADWVVKLIDVYPDEDSYHPETAGQQMGIAFEIFRGRYVKDFAKPQPLKAGKVENYKFGLPNVNHVFLKGHRIMVQVQSTWFPLYDRNPQTFVPNIFWARPAAP